MLGKAIKDASVQTGLSALLLIREVSSMLFEALHRA
jgi:hypothetical protein